MRVFALHVILRWSAMGQPYIQCMHDINSALMTHGRVDSFVRLCRAGQHHYVGRHL